METEEQKLLEIYKARRSALTQELDLLNKLINLIDTRQMMFGDPSDQINSKSKGDDSTSQANRKIINFHHSFLGKSLNLYNQSMTYNEKIIFVLNKLGTATVQEIFVFLQSYEDIQSTSHFDKFFSGLTMAASGLNVKREIHSRKVGKKNEYSLTPFSDEEEQEEVDDI